MGPTANEIEQHIASVRGKLDQNINEIQTRVKNATDWRWQVKKQPLAAVGIALAGGFLAARLVRPSRGHRSNSHGEAQGHGEGARYAAQRYSEPHEKSPRLSRPKDVMMGFAMGLGLRRLGRFLQT